MLANALTAATLLLGGVAWRASLGPIETPPPDSLIQILVERAAPGWRVETSGAAFDLTAGAYGGVTLRDATLSDEAGRVALRASEFELGVRLAPALAWREALSVSSATLRGAVFEVARTPDGYLIGEGVALPGPAGGNPGPKGPGALLRTAAALTETPRLRLEGATLRYRDAQTGAALVVTDASLRVAQERRGLTARLDGVAPTLGGRASLEARLDRRGTLSLSAEAREINPAPLGALDAALSPLARIDAPASGAASAVFDSAGALRAASGRLRFGAGSAVLGRAGARAFEAASADFEIDAVSGRFELSRAAIAAPEGRATFSALAQARPDGRYDATLSLDSADWTAPGTGRRVAIEAARARAIADPQARRIEALSLRAGALRAADPALGRLSATEIAATGGLDLTAGRIRDLALSARSLTAVPAEGAATARAAGVALSGDYDWRSGTLTLAQGAADEAILRDPTGSAALHRLEASARIDLAAGRAEDVRLTAQGLDAVDAHAARTAQAGRADLRGAVDWRAGIADISNAMIESLSLRDPETSFSIARIEGGARADLVTADLLGARLTADGLSGHAADGAFLRIERAGLEADYRAAARSLSIDALRLERVSAAASADEAPVAAPRATLSGRVDLATARMEDATLRAQTATLPLPGLYAAPLALEDVAARFALALEDGGARANVSELSARVDGVPARAHGALTLRNGGGVAGEVVSAIGPARFASVPALWPAGVAPGASRWVAENVRSGAVDAVKIDAAFDTDFPDRDSLLLSFDFRDATLDYLRGLPPIEAARGRGTATLDRFDLALESGVARVPGEGPLALGASRFAIDDLTPAIPHARIALDVRGPVRAALRLLDREPLGFISKSGLDIASVNGEAEAEVALALPLANDLRVEDVDVDARARVTDYRLREPRSGESVSGGLMKVAVTSESLRLQSDARIGGLAARLGYREAFAAPPPGRPRGELTVAAMLTLEDLAGHGLDLGEAARGAAAIDARIGLRDDGVSVIDATLDLSAAELALAPLGWRKPAGAAATLELSGALNPDGSGAFHRVVASGERIAAEGSLGFDAAGAVREARFPRLNLGESADLALTYRRDAQGGGAISVSGGALDLREPFRRALERGDGSATAPQTTPESARMTVALAVSRVLLREDLTLFDLDAEATLSRQRLLAARAKGALNGSAPAAFLARREAGGLALRLTAPDAGAFMRAADVFTGAYDGALLIEAFAADGTGGALSGSISVDDLVIHDAPTMRRILDGAPMAGLMGDIANGGLAFSKVRLPFESAGPRWRIARGVAYGPSVGLTLDGSYDVEARALDLSGSLSPAYAINGAFAKVPVIGEILTGGEGGGVFGLTFTVRGDADAPDVWVNPLSALAPGFLRDVVSGALAATDSGSGSGAQTAERDRPFRFTTGADR